MHIKHIQLKLICLKSDVMQGQCSLTVKSQNKMHTNVSL